MDDEILINVSNYMLFVEGRGKEDEMGEFISNAIVLLVLFLGRKK